MQMPGCCCYPTEQGLQLLLDMDLLEQYWQNWALTVNVGKSKIMIFQKTTQTPSGNQTLFCSTLPYITLDNVTSFKCLGLKMNASGNFGLAVKTLKVKARRTFMQ